MSILTALQMVEFLETARSIGLTRQERARALDKWRSSTDAALSARAENFLRKLLGDDYSPDDVARLTRQRLLSAPEIGTKTVDEVERWLSTYELTFSPH